MVPRMKSQVITIDCDYVMPEFAAAYLMVEGSRALFIENNTAHAVPKLLAALKRTGLSPEAVEYLIITHVHLDHAGGTSALLKHCPNAQVLAHPKAAKAIIDPSRLVASAKRVYGEANFAALYGELSPIEAVRVRALDDGATIRFGERTLSFFYTKGHATHHFCIHDSGTNGVFTGDAFGLRYPALQSRGLFIFPSSSPIDFDPPEARLSIDRIVGTGADRAFLTHYGEVAELRTAREQLLLHLDAHARALDEAQASSLSGAPLVALCEKRLREHFARYFEQHGGDPGKAAWEVLKLDIEINAQGIAYVAEKRRASV